MIVQHLLKRLMDNIFHNIIPMMIPLLRSIKNILETELIVPQISFTESKFHLLLPMLPKIEKCGPLYAIKNVIPNSNGMMTSIISAKARSDNVFSFSMTKTSTFGCSSEIFFSVLIIMVEIYQKFDNKQAVCCHLSCR